jgi:ATP/maltotriose-dependent transcriptional regulator MalT/DNA-binding SARP family transcriptional activator
MEKLLRGVSESKVTLVTAPAGFGKTITVAELLECLDGDAAWYSIDPLDDELGRFFSYLVASLQSVRPGLGRRTLALLDNPTAHLTPETLAGALTTDLQLDGGAWFAWVLDDVHHLTSGPVLRALDLLMSHLADHCHLILTSRTQPRLPSLPRLVALRAVTRVGSDDLRFSEAELAAFLQPLHSFSPSEIRQIATITEGWIAAAALMTQQPSLLSAGLVPTEDLAPFLAAEIFDRLTEPLQTFLLQTALLPEVSPTLCREVFDYRNIGTFRQQLEDAGVLLQRTDVPETFRYHGLFQEFLKQRAQAMPECHWRWRCAIAAYFVRRGWIAEAVEHQLAANDPQGARQTLRRASGDMYYAGKWRQLVKLVDVVHGSLREEDPWLQVWAARCSVQLGDPHNALLRCSRIEPEQLAADPSLKGAVAVAQVAAIRNQGDTGRALSLARSALGDLPDVADRVTQLLRGELLHFVGVSLEHQGLRAESLLPLTEALCVYTAEGSAYHQARAHNDLAVVHGRLGAYATATAHYEQAVVQYRQINNVAGLASALNNLANCYALQGEIRLALDVVTSALAAAKESGSLRLIAYSTRTMGDLRCAEGDYGQAAELQERARQSFLEANEKVLVARTALALARTLCLAGRLENVESLIASAGAYVNTDGRPLDRGVLAFTTGLSALVLSQSMTARSALTEAVEAFSQAGDVRWMQRARLLLAEALCRQGERDSALTELAQISEAVDSAPGAFTQEAVVAQTALALAIAALSQGGVFAQLLGKASAPPSSGGLPRNGRTPDAPPQVIRLYTLGAERIEVDGRPITDREALTGKGRELLVYLLTHRGRAPRRALIETLWPDLDPLRPTSVLRTTVYRLRRAMGTECINVQGDWYALSDSYAFWLDAREFRSLDRRARDVSVSEPDRMLAFERALALYKGAFLPGCPSEWCLTERHNLEVRYSGLVRSLVRVYAKAGLLDRALGVCDSLLSEDPLDENAALLSVQLRLLKGDAKGGQESWQAYVTLLRQELQTSPSAKAVQRIRSLFPTGRFQHTA